MKKALLLSITLVVSTLVLAQTPAPQVPPVATDISAVDMQAFIDKLPRDRVSDRPISVVEVTGDYRIGVFGVYRPEEVAGDVNVHLVNTTEIYYMLKGYATLVTGGDLVDEYAAEGSTSWVRAKSIENGVTRRVGPGDLVIIPGHTPHWWSDLEGDIEYMIIRPDPDNRLELR